MPREESPALRDRTLKGLSEDDRTLIDAVQPYRRGRGAPHNPLAVLQRLSNVDKHQVIHAAWTMFEEPSASDFVLRSTSGAAVADIELMLGPIRVEAEIVRAQFTSDPGAQVHMDGYLTAVVAFGEPSGVRDLDLGMIFGRVREIVDSFAGRLSD